MLCDEQSKDWINAGEMWDSWLLKASFLFIWAAMSQTSWVNIKTKTSRVNHFLRNGKPRMIDLIFSQWTCGACCQTAVVTADGTNFPKTICIYLVISLPQLMSYHLEVPKTWLLTEFSTQQEEFGLPICQSDNQQLLLLKSGFTVWNTACLQLRKKLLCGALQILD